MSKLLLRHARRMMASEPLRQEPDTELLRRFAEQRDEAAFAALVQRHGRTVWSVCRNVLGQDHDAEDAFQATFLALAQKAGRVHNRDAVAAWLHGVARRVALSTRRATRRRRAHEQRSGVVDRPAGPPASLEASFREVRAVLDEELAGLPPGQRAAFVLCCLNGKTAAEAARQLGRGEGAVAVALHRARENLARRLAGRGVTLAVALGAASVFAAGAGGAVPAALVRSTIERVTNVVSGTSTGAASSAVATLTERSVTVMTLTKLKAALGLAVLVVIAVGIGAGRPEAEPPPGVRPGAALPPAAGPPELRRPPADVFGDSLPRGAVVRLGTRRLTHTSSVSSVSFSPDGKRLASVATGETVIHLWDVPTGAPAGRITIRGKACSATFSPDGRTLAIGVLGAQNASEIQIWNLAGPEMVRRFDAGEQFWLGPLAYSPDGKTLVSTRREPKGKAVVRLWDVATGKARHALEEHTGEVRGVTFAPDGRTLATAGSDDRVILWDTGTGKQVREIKAGGVWSVAFSPDGNRVYASRNTAVEAWETATGKSVTQFETRFGGTTHMALSRDGKSLAACGARYDAARQELVRCVFIWDTATGKERHFDRSQEELGRLAFSPDGKLLASTGNGGNTAVRLWDGATGTSVLGDEAAGARVDSVSFSADGRVVAAGERLWEAATGRLLRTLKADGYFPSGISAFGPSGTTLGSGSLGEGGAVSLWNTESGREERRLPSGEVGIVRHLSFSADGRVVACSGGHNVPQPPAKPDLQVRLWDTVRGKEIGRFSAEQDWPSDGTLSPDGKLFAVGGYSNGSIALWDTATGKEARRLRGHGGMVNAVAFSPDGKFLASGSSDRTIGVWDVGTGNLLRWLDQGHREAITGVAFSPDGRSVASGGRDHAVGLWEVSTGKLRRLFEGHQGSVRAVAFAPDGRHLASGSEDGTGLVWDVTGTASAGAAPARLSAEELDTRWARLGGDDAGTAHQAAWDLATVPGQSVPFLRGRLKPAIPLDATAQARVVKLVGELNADVPATRERAAGELTKLGEAAVPALRAALKAAPSSETQGRIERVLQQAEALSGDRLRAVRAIEALENCGTTEARAVLAQLAAGDPSARITVEAATAAERLAKRQGKR